MNDFIKYCIMGYAVAILFVLMVIAIALTNIAEEPSSEFPDTIHVEIPDLYSRMDIVEEDTKFVRENRQMLLAILEGQKEMNKRIQENEAYNNKLFRSITGRLEEKPKPGILKPVEQPPPPKEEVEEPTKEKRPWWRIPFKKKKDDR